MTAVPLLKSYDLKTAGEIKLEFYYPLSLSVEDQDFYDILCLRINGRTLRIESIESEPPRENSSLVWKVKYLPKNKRIKDDDDVVVVIETRKPPAGGGLVRTSKKKAAKPAKKTSKKASKNK
jgi:hypothetical protein